MPMSAMEEQPAFRVSGSRQSLNRDCASPIPGVNGWSGGGLASFRSGARLARRTKVDDPRSVRQDEKIGIRVPEDNVADREDL